MKNKINIILIFFLIIGVSCTVDEGCRKSKTVNMGIGIYHVTHVDSTNVNKITALSVDSLSLQGLGVDSILYNNQKTNNSKLVAPLNKIDTQSKFVATFNTIKDTITVVHTNTNYFMSLECGCIEVYNIDTVLTTHNFIDSVKIKIHDVNTTNAEHLQIYH